MKGVLVVDDDPDILDVFQTILESEDFNFFTLTSPRSIFKTIENFNPDLIILDIMLGGMDGRAVFSALKENEKTINIPVIMTSARFDETFTTT